MTEINTQAGESRGQQSDHSLDLNQARGVKSVWTGEGVHITPNGGLIQDADAFLRKMEENEIAVFEQTSDPRVMKGVDRHSAGKPIPTRDSIY